MEITLLAGKEMQWLKKHRHRTLQLSDETIAHHYVWPMQAK